MTTAGGGNTRVLFYIVSYGNLIYFWTTDKLSKNLYATMRGLEKERGPKFISSK